MSSSARRLPLVDATRIAQALVAELRPACERIEVAGSVRRRRPEVGDIELVVLPKMVEDRSVNLDMFAPAPLVSALDARLATLALVNRLVLATDKPANGERYKKLVAVKAEVQVDLFIVRPPAHWGPILFIRTGPAEYSARAVTALHGRGLRSDEGRIMRGNDVLPCPEERDFFDYLGWPFQAPELRR